MNFGDHESTDNVAELHCLLQQYLEEASDTLKFFETRQDVVLDVLDAVILITNFINHRFKINFVGEVVLIVFVEDILDDNLLLIHILFLHLKFLLRFERIKFQNNIVALRNSFGAFKLPLLSIFVAIFHFSSKHLVLVFYFK